MFVVRPGGSVSVVGQRKMCVDIAVLGNPILAWPVVKPTPVATSLTAVRCVTMLPRRKATSAYTCSQINILIMFKMGDTRTVTCTLLTLPTIAAPPMVTQWMSLHTSSHSLFSRLPPSLPRSHHLHTLTLMVSGGGVMRATMRPALLAICAYIQPARNTHTTC